MSEPTQPSQPDQPSRFSQLPADEQKVRWELYGEHKKQTWQDIQASTDRSTDQIVCSFGSDFEPLIEFGSSAIAKIVNNRNTPLLQQSISFLHKRQQKLIRENFEFLLENEVRCEPLRPSTVEIGHRLLEALQFTGEKFKSSFRNTWNDVLILAAAWDHEDELWSKDNQLNRLAASAFGESTQRMSGFFKIRFREAGIGKKRRTSRESGRHVNRGWRATFKAASKQAW